jgi:hypothetical protein
VRPRRAILIVGHENWGKSLTLRALTNGSSYQRHIVIAGVQFFIRRMSNDDQPDGYFDFIRAIDPGTIPNLIATLCANFQRTEARTDQILQILRSKGYQIVFWVIRHQYGTDSVVTPDQVARLRTYGIVEIHDARSEAAVRARQFHTFVSNVVTPVTVS